jgi:transcriptional regulator with XRE-family HTH domain
MSKFPERIKWLRETKTKLSQRKFGELYGVIDSTVSRWEKGKSVPGPELLAKIANDYGVSVDWLMGQDTNNDLNKIDLMEIKKALLEKELIYNGYELTEDEQESIRSVLLAVIEREEKNAEKFNSNSSKEH